MLPYRAFIGYDPREEAAYEVCRASMLRHATRPILIEPLIRSRLETLGAYRRWYTTEGSQRVDLVDGRPFSTEFTFTRFLVPALTQYRGHALFCDSDFLWRDDPCKLFLLTDRQHAVHVVKHEHTPEETTKMRGQRQSQYPRKNWSSLMLWHCSHEANRALTPFQVNNQPGRWLHTFGWLEDEEIGEIHHSWNWLEGHSPDWVVPKAVHFTRGTPDMPGKDLPYADEWWSYLEQGYDSNHVQRA